MNALGLFAYLLGCLAIGGVLTLVVAMMRSVKSHDNFRSWRWLMAFSVLAAAAPYLYAEGMTQLYGQDMQTAVEKTLKSAKVKGKLSHFKILRKSDGAAEVIIVAKEKTTMSNSESCVMKATLKRDPKKGWLPDEYEFIDSFERGKDSVTMPPYW